MSVWDKWDKNIDTEGLAQDTKEAEQNGGSGEYSEVPTGTYEVKVEKMELKESSKGDPMFTAWFRIVEGSHKKQMLFMNQIILEGWQIGIVNKFLRSLDATGAVSVEFKTYGQYNNLIMDLMEEIDGKFEYLLEFKKSDKGFPIYTVKEVYDV